MRNAGPAYGRFISHEQVNVSHVVAFLARSVMKTALVLIAIVGVAGYFVFTSSDFMNFDPTQQGVTAVCGGGSARLACRSVAVVRA